MDELKIFKEAVYLGLKFGLIFFIIMTAILGSLFGFYIYKSYDNEFTTMTTTQDGANNYQEVQNGKTNS